MVLAFFFYLATLGKEEIAHSVFKRLGLRTRHKNQGLFRKGLGSQIGEKMLVKIHVEPLTQQS